MIRTAAPKFVLPFGGRAYLRGGGLLAMQAGAHRGPPGYSHSIVPGGLLVTS